MVDSEMTRSLAMALPGVVDESSPEHLTFSINTRGFAWSLMQRDTPRQKRWPNIEVLAVTCPLEHKELLMEAAPDIFFDDPHYRGYPAVLVRLAAIKVADLADLLKSGHAMQLAKPQKRSRSK